MGVKSTVELTRKEAERRWVRMIERSARTLEEAAASFTDEELENQLELLNDAAHGGQGFENFRIVEP